jgi:cephalosporin-C deacetylase
MYQFDMPVAELQHCMFPQAKEPDFNRFWGTMLGKSRQQPLHPSAETVNYPVQEVRVEKVSFAAFDGGRITGWSITPSQVKARPTLLFFHGYRGNRGKVAEYLMWALQGFTCLAFDVRGQCGESCDFAEYPGGRAMGWLTSGILDPEKYYLVRCYIDAVRAIDFASTCIEVDSKRMAICGHSQGGGLALAAVSLDDRPKLCIAEQPAFCHFSRTLEVTRMSPWDDLLDYFSRRPEDIEQALRTLSYVELNNMTDRVRCAALVSVGLQDEVCVPSSIYSAYNHIPSRDKQLEAFPYNVHEGGLNIETQIVWVRKHLLSRGFW